MAATKVFVQSDPHLFHKLVSSLRGFETPEDFNEWFIDDWQSKVGVNDQVWLLGDLTGGGYLTEALMLLHILPGEKHLIIGNHDGCFPDHRDSHRRIARYYEVFSSVQMHARRRINGVNCLVSHFPYTGDHTNDIRHQQWQLHDRGLPIIHGHTHSSDILSYTSHGTPQVNVAYEAVKGLVTFDSLHKYLEPKTDHNDIVKNVEDGDQA